MNVSGWREEPAQQSQAEARLLRWIDVVQCDPQAGSDELAYQLALAWRELLEADSVAVWLDGDITGLLEPQGLAGSWDEKPDDETRVPIGDADWPLEPFFFLESEGLTRDLIAKLGLLSEKVAAPSFCIPFGAHAIALVWLSSEDGRLGDEWKPITATLCKQSAAVMDRTLRTERMGRSFHQLAGVIANAIDAHEKHREGYAPAVAYYAGLIAREMGLDDALIERVEFAALWHGIGRLIVPSTLLEKGAPFSPEDLKIVYDAATWGAEQVAQVTGLEDVGTMIGAQHEKYDGTGAPEGLMSKEIPVGARILAVAARFAAMTRRREDRAPLSVVGGAMEELAQSAGTALDPEVVDAFLRAMGRSK